MKFTYPWGTRVFAAFATLLFTSVLPLSHFWKASRGVSIFTDITFAIFALFCAYFLLTTLSTLECTTDQMSYRYMGFLRRRSFPYSALSGWYITPDRPAQLQFFFNASSTVEFPAHSPGLLAFYDRLVAEHSPRIHQEARELLGRAPVRIDGIFTTMIISPELVQITRFGRTRRYRLSEAVRRQLRDNGFVKLLRLHFSSGSVTITSYQLRKQLGVFWILCEIVGVRS